MYTFLFERNFYGLLQADIDTAYEEVSTLYSGVAGLWAVLGKTLQDKKVSLCYQYLTAWYLCNMYPSSVRGVDSDGRPLSAKTIGGVSLTFASGNNQQDGLLDLSTNTFGLKAKSMIESAPERMGVYG